MIQSLEKPEEYRDISPYWKRVFKENGKIKIKGKYYHPSDVMICFSNGYAKDRDQMYCDLLSYRVGEGLQKWGAIPGKQYFVLRITPASPDK